jgi:hypothetical protein
MEIDRGGVEQVPTATLDGNLPLIRIDTAVVVEVIRALRWDRFGVLAFKAACLPGNLLDKIPSLA